MDSTTLGAFGDFIPAIAAHLGLSGSTLLAIIIAIIQVSKFLARRIPNDATGFWAQLRMICTIISSEQSSVVTKGVTIQDVSASALKTAVADKPPVADKLDQEKQP